MPEPPAAPPVGEPTRLDLLAQARQLQRNGFLTQAWRVCEEVAEASRQASDAGTLADAATLLQNQYNPRLMGQVQALCLEALAALGDSDPVRTTRVRAQLAATSSPFLEDVQPPPGTVTPEEAAARFLDLQARYATLLDADHLGERLAIADATIELGRSAGQDEFVRWGLRWRLDVHAALGHRVDLTMDLNALEPLVERLGQPGWRSLVRMIDASQRHWDGRFAEALRLGAEAAELGGTDSEAARFRLVVEWDVRRLTGEGLAETEIAVRTVVDQMPWLARGWLCLVLLACDRQVEAEALWRAVAPHVRRLPARAPEWLVAGQGHAELCVAFGDVETAKIVYAQLRPYEHLHSIAYSYTPYGGPLALGLGRLAVLLGDREAGRRHLELALRLCAELHAPAFLALTHSALAPLVGLQTRAGREHADQALRLARQLGMRPLEAELTALLDQPGRAGELTRRETEIAALVAASMSNAAIARRLTMSERTVENHVSHILRKLDCTSRAGVAAWWAGGRGVRT